MTIEFLLNTVSDYNYYLYNPEFETSNEYMDYIDYYL